MTIAQSAAYPKTGSFDGIAATPLHAEQISARIERLPFSGWHLRMVGTVGLASFFDAFDSVTIAFVLPVLGGLWHLTPGQIGFLISSGFVGQLIGAIVLSALAERIGRVTVLQWAIGILGLLSLGCALVGVVPGWAYAFPVFLVLRFVQGVGLGAEVPIAATYINEASSGRFRGRLVYLLETAFATGVMMTSLVALWLIPTYGWQSMFYVGGLPVILALLLARLIPESPRWLAGRRRFAEADRVMDRIESEVSAGGSRPLPPLAALIPLPKTAPVTFASLFQDGYAGRTIVCWTMMFCTSLSGYGLISWMPTIYRTVYHAPLQDALRYSFIGSFAGLLAAFLGTAVIDIIGRRWTYAIGFAGCAVPLLILWRLPADIAVTTVFELATTSYFFVSILLAGLYAYIPEIYPTRMRALGTGVASSWLRIASIAGPTIVGFLLQDGGINAVYAFFGLSAAAGALVTIFFVIETRGRALEDIAR